jgi:CDP-6-deoxy-D-xylo-4-hexulose-3-dehydrase
MVDTAAQLRRQILDLTAQYCSEFSRPGEFIPGVSPVPVSGKVIDGDDVSAVVDSALDSWFTTGRFAETFERNLARFVGVRSASLVNSGSSANLVAGFPTTVNPIFQNRLVPVFVDVTVPGYEIDVHQLEAARSDRTRAVFLAHTLGNTFDLDAVTAFTQKHNLWLIED